MTKIERLKLGSFACSLFQPQFLIKQESILNSAFFGDNFSEAKELNVGLVALNRS